MIMSEWLCLCVATITSLLLVAAYICLYSGLLSAITVVAGSPPIKKILFAYKYNEGPYRDCEKISRESLSIGPKLPCIYVFYDDPQKVTGPLCRCAVGSVLSEGETPADQELLKRYETSGFGVFSFPEVTHVVTAATSLPHTTFFSLLLRVKRVYPRLQHYIKERRLCAHPFLEICRGRHVQFMAPLARQGDFYVPETRQVEKKLSEPEESYSDTELSDSNSEYSSGSGVLLSDSPESSPAPSSVHSEDRRSSGGACPHEQDWKETAGQLDRDAVQKELGWWVVGEEE